MLNNQNKNEKKQTAILLSMHKPKVYSLPLQSCRPHRTRQMQNSGTIWNNNRNGNGQICTEEYASVYTILLFHGFILHHKPITRSIQPTRTPIAAPYALAVLHVTTLKQWWYYHAFPFEFKRNLARGYGQTLHSDLIVECREVQ